MRSTWTIETMVLPELSRTMAYKTRKTINRLERKQLHFIGSGVSKTQTSKLQTSDLRPQTSKTQTSKTQTSKPQTSKPQTSKLQTP